MEFNQLPPVLIHIGFHKTGTSFLQKKLFVNEQLGFYQYPFQETPKLVHCELAKLGPFDKVKEDTIVKLREFAEEARKKGLIMVLSHERLSGYPASGGYDSKFMIDCLQQIFPNAKLLIVIREQISLIYSVYSQMITDGASYSLQDFLNPPNNKIVRVPQFQLGYYEFDKIISYCQTVFGKDHVLALPYELLQDDYKEFINRIGNFALESKWQKIIENCKMPENTPVNTQKNILLQSVKRFANAYFYKNQLSNYAVVNKFPVRQKIINLSRSFIEVFIPKDLDNYLDDLIKNKNTLLIKNHVGLYYKESNINTRSLIDIDLGNYGYTI